MIILQCMIQILNFTLINVAGITPDTHLLHLKVGVYIFFHRLYAMYPNHTVAFMKSFYDSNHGKDIQRSIEVSWSIITE